MIEKRDTVIVCLACRFLAPFIMLCGLYIVAHGHYFPGGGFQGGVIIAVSFILLILGEGSARVKNLLPEHRQVVLISLGALIFVGIGFLPMIFGGKFLDYGQIPLLSLAAPYVRYFMILFVEIAIAITVMGVLYAIFVHTITEREYD
jgi:multicomponent Na+:H+ antiporter subunit B